MLALSVLLAVLGCAVAALTLALAVVIWYGRSRLRAFEAAFSALADAHEAQERFNIHTTAAVTSHAEALRRAAEGPRETP
jgi:uncharacterized membrane protein